MFVNVNVLQRVRRAFYNKMNVRHVRFVLIIAYVYTYVLTDKGIDKDLHEFCLKKKKKRKESDYGSRSIDRSIVINGIVPNRFFKLARLFKRISLK